MGRAAPRTTAQGALEVPDPPAYCVGGTSLICTDARRNVYGTWERSPAPVTFTQETSAQLLSVNRFLCSPNRWFTYGTCRTFTGRLVARLCACAYLTMCAFVVRALVVRDARRDGSEVRLCDPCVPCVPCVSRLPRCPVFLPVLNRTGNVQSDPTVPVIVYSTVPVPGTARSRAVVARAGGGVYLCWWVWMVVRFFL